MKSIFIISKISNLGWFEHNVVFLDEHCQIVGFLSSFVDVEFGHTALSYEKVFV